MRGLRNWRRKIENIEGEDFTGRRFGPNSRWRRMTSSESNPSFNVSNLAQTCCSDSVCHGNDSDTDNSLAPWMMLERTQRGLSLDYPLPLYTIISYLSENFANRNIAGGFSNRQSASSQTAPIISEKQRIRVNFLYPWSFVSVFTFRTSPDPQTKRKSFLERK